MSVQIPFPLPATGFALNSKVRVNLDFIVAKFNEFNTGTATWDAVYVGTGGSVNGAITLYNSSNGFYTTIQSGVATANQTYTWNVAVPAAEPALQYCTTGGVLSWKQMLGTTNQVVIANNAGNLTWSLPQSIHTAATPTFASLTLGTSNSTPKLILDTNVGISSSGATMYFWNGDTNLPRMTLTSTTSTEFTVQELTDGNARIYSWAKGTGDSFIISRTSKSGGIFDNTGFGWQTDENTDPASIDYQFYMYLDPSTPTYLRLADGGYLDVNTFMEFGKTWGFRNYSGIIDLERYHVTRGTYGLVRIQSADSAFTDWTFTLPVNDGTSGQILTTDGSGVTSWADASGTAANLTLSNLSSPTAVNQILNMGTNGISGTDVDLALGTGDITTTGTLNLTGAHTHVATPVSGSDAVTLLYLQNSIGIQLNYYLSGSSVMKSGYTAGAGFTTNVTTVDAETELTSIIYRSAVADTATPFTIKNGTEFLAHFSAKVSAGHAGITYKNVVVRCKLFYADADGTSNLVQIGAATTDSAVLTATNIIQELSGIVATEVTVPAGKRLVLKFYAVCSGTAPKVNYPTVNAEYGDVHDHCTIGVTGILGNFLPFSGGTMTGAVTIPSSNLLLQEVGSTDVATIAVASLGAARTYTIPDAGADASFVMTEGTQTVNGAKTFGSAPTLSSLTVSRALTVNGSGVVTVSATTDTELGYVSGVTSAIQTQLGTKAPVANPTFTGVVAIADGAANAPSLTFTTAASKNTGLFLAAADSLGITTDGVERVRIDSAGTTTLTNVSAFTLANPGTETLTTLLLKSPSASGDGNYGGTLSFGKNGALGKVSAIVGVQTSSDNDINGLAFITHASATSTADMIEAARITGAGKVLLGLTTSFAVGGAEAKLQIHGVDQVSSFATLVRHSADAFGPAIGFGKSRAATLNDVTVVQANDVLGDIYFCGADGTDVATQGARIRAEVDGTPGSNDLPTRLTFSTTSDGASSVTERLRIDSIGAVTQASQPCFLVTDATGATDVTGNGTTYTELWPTEVYDIGSNFASNTFTAPVTGKYFLQASVRLIGMTSSHVLRIIRMVTSNRTMSVANTSGSVDYQEVISGLFDMDANDTAEITVYADGSTKTADIAASAITNYFSGTLIN